MPRSCIRCRVRWCSVCTSRLDFRACRFGNPVGARVGENFSSTRRPPAAGHCILDAHSRAATHVGGERSSWGIIEPEDLIQHNNIFQPLEAPWLMHTRCKLDRIEYAIMCKRQDHAPLCGSRFRCPAHYLSACQSSQQRRTACVEICQLIIPALRPSAP